MSSPLQRTAVEMCGNTKSLQPLLNGPSVEILFSSAVSKGHQ